MDVVREVLILVARYYDERQWLGSGRDGDAWPSVDVVQRIAVANPKLYYEELRSMKCLASHSLTVLVQDGGVRPSSTASRVDPGAEAL
eukprot:SAG11_NODE_1900_length_4091_cov_2.418838_6_plen_88_part_00